MSFYQVLINGQNYLMRMEGKKELLGFYTTRFIEASDPSEAELKAADSIRNDERFSSGNILNRKWFGKKPMIYIEEMYEINQEDMQDNHGFSWYPMNES